MKIEINLVKWSILVCFLTATGIQLSLAQEKKRLLTLEETLEITKERYPAIKAAHFQIEAKKTKKATAYNWGITRLSTSGDEIKKGTVGSSKLLAITQEDIDLLGIKAKRRARQSEVKLAKSQAEITQAEVLLNVEYAYYNLLLKQESLKVLQQIDQIYKDFVLAAKLRYETEATTRLEWLSAKMKRNEISLQITKCKGEIKSAQASLNQYIGAEFDYQVKEVTLSLNTVQLDISKNKDLIWANDLYHQDVATWKENRTGLLPKFSIELSNQEIAGNKNYWGYEVSLSVPLFNGKYSENKAQKIELKSKKLELETKKLQVLALWKNKKASYNALNKAIIYYTQQAVPLANEKMKAAQLAYKIGEIDYINYIQSVETQLNTLINFEQRKFEYRNLIAELRRIAGNN